MTDYYPDSAYQSPPSSTMAIISLVAGILGLTFMPIIGSIVALIVGYMARTEIQNSNGTLGGDGMATAGLVMGWIGVGLTVIGCCIGGAFLLLTACLIPLGTTLNQSGSLLPFLILMV